MLWTIGVLAVGAACAGLLNLPGASHSLTNFLDPPLPLGIEPSGGQEFGTSVLAVALALDRLRHRLRAVGPPQ